MQNGEYALAFTLLDKTDLTDLPAKYADLPDIRKEAAWQEAERLMEAGQPYDALPYYRAVPGYKKAVQRMESLCYRIIGTWEDENGAAYAFNEDGSCTLAGTAMMYSVNDYAMSTGASKDALLITHRISSVKENSAVIYDLRDGTAKTIRLTRVEVTAAPVEEQTDVEVVDE